MFTQIYLYIVTYVLTFLLIFYYFFVHNININIAQKNFTAVWSGLGMYFRQSWLFKFLIFQLSGLPPVFFFFLKFSFLIGSIEYINLVYVALLFLNIILGTFFYLQIFFSTNTKVDNNLLRSFVEDSPILVTTKKVNVKKLYSCTYIIVTFLFFNIFSVFFFLDFYVIGASQMLF